MQFSRFPEHKKEEIDHLAWCADRLAELGSGPSIANPLFYASSFALGALSRWLRMSSIGVSAMDSATTSVSAPAHAGINSRSRSTINYLWSANST